MMRRPNKGINYVLGSTHSGAYNLVLNDRWGAILKSHWNIDDSVLCWRSCKYRQHSKSFLYRLCKSASLTRVPARLSDHQPLIDGAMHILTIQPHFVLPEKKPATLQRIVQVASVSPHCSNSAAVATTLAFCPALYGTTVHAHIFHVAGPLIPAAWSRMYDPR